MVRSPLARRPVVELAPGVFRVPIAPRDSMNVFVLVADTGAVTLIDAGTRSAPERIVAALRGIGHDASDVVEIVVTHAHFDHAGGLATMRGRTGARVSVHQADAAYLRTGATPTVDRGSRVGRVLRGLPVGGFSPVEASAELRDGDTLTHMPAVEVIHTPGHTPGHLSLLDREHGVLFTGDVVMHLRNRVSPAPAFLCTDVRTNNQAVARLSNLEFSTLAFSHGAEMREGSRAALEALVDGGAREGSTTAPYG